jgi:dipeptidyl aminopeptidase/acylaminoacyl peptidase
MKPARCPGGGASLLALAALLAATTASQAQTKAAVPDPAAQFGAQELVAATELSPDGKRVVVVQPGPGTTNLAAVIDIATGVVTPVAGADGQPMRITHCGWSSADRVVCAQSGSLWDHGKIVSYARVFAVDADGRNSTPLGQRDSDIQLYARQFDGQVIDWRDGSDGKVLMSRYYVPEQATGRLTAHTEEGYGVDLVDTRTQKSTTVERPSRNVHYLSDGHGVVRLMSRQLVEREQLLSGKLAHYYRAQGEREWRELGTDDMANSGIEPLAVDSAVNAAYVLKTLNGRRALYRIALDGSLKSELVFAHQQVDVVGIVTVGRGGRVIGAYYVTDKPQIEYFDPDYRTIAASLARAIPRLPIISVISASANEQVLLVFANSDIEPGRYYLFDRTGKRLVELLPVRPALDKVALAPVKPVSYPAADGTPVPAYLTLPPGVAQPSGLPAIVMPHGGPASRDIWGFDWLAQYYANRGFAVLQPNYRGSAGFGDNWFQDNGFKSWKIAVNDVVDGGRWLVTQGVADPARLAIVGWSYGGYAALQSNIVDPDLFKAVVAIAPVTDLEMLKTESEGFTNELVQKDYLGSGPHIMEGSPARHPESFKAPVMLFHGDLDSNVSALESRAMDRALRRVGKRCELTIYPKLDHQLRDNAARADMLRRSYEFLRTNLHL